MARLMTPEDVLEFEDTCMEQTQKPDETERFFDFVWTLFDPTFERLEANEKPDQACG